MPKISLLKGVEKYLTEKAKNNPRDNSHFHPSSWDDCKRKIAYQFYEAKGYISVQDNAIKVSPQLERIFDNGHFVHARWQQYLSCAAPQAVYGRWLCANPLCGLVYGTNSKLGIPRPQKCTTCDSPEFKYQEVGFFDEETMWGGHVDAIVDVRKWNEAIVGRLNPQNSDEIADEIADEMIAVNVFQYPDEDDSIAILDYKSMNPFDFKKLDKPKSEHITQIQIYMYLSGLKYSKFIYEDKSNQSVKEFLVERDDNLLQVKINEAKELKYVVLNMKSSGKRALPDRGYREKSHKKCLRCKYRGHCWK
jgi:hypothetical protein